MDNMDKKNRATHVDYDKREKEYEEDYEEEYSDYEDSIDDYEEVASHAGSLSNKVVVWTILLAVLVAILAYTTFKLKDNYEQKADDKQGIVADITTKDTTRTLKTPKGIKSEVNEDGTVRIFVSNVSKGYKDKTVYLSMLPSKRVLQLASTIEGTDMLIRTTTEKIASDTEIDDISIMAETTYVITYGELQSGKHEDIEIVEDGGIYLLLLPRDGITSVSAPIAEGTTGVKHSDRFIVEWEPSNSADKLILTVERNTSLINKEAE